MSVTVPKTLLDGLIEYDNRTQRLVVASAVGGKPVMRAAHATLGDALSRPGKVSVIGALMELQAASILKVIGINGEGIEVEVL